MSRSVLTASLLLPPSRAAADLGLMPRFPLDLLVSIPARPGVGSTYLRHLGLSLSSRQLWILIGSTGGITVSQQVIQDPGQVGTNFSRVVEFI